MSHPRTTVAIAETPQTSSLGTCPLCHTNNSSVTSQKLSSGGGWRCVRCGQQWDTRRLEAVAAYVIWAAEHKQAPQTVMGTHDVRR